MVWAWVWKISPSKLQILNFIPSGPKKKVPGSKAGWLLVYRGFKYTRVGSGPISNFFIDGSSTWSNPCWLCITKTDDEKGLVQFVHDWKFLMTLLLVSYSIPFWILHKKITPWKIQKGWETFSHLKAVSKVFERNSLSKR